jgi:23S rRNA (uracil1939-C5)-methyltransferase
MQIPRHATITLDKIVGGGQALGTLDDGRKAFIWGGLPGELVEIQITKKKHRFVEGFVTKVLVASPERIEPLDPTSYLSTSPWQIMSFDAEQRYKAALIEEAFELHAIVLPNPIEVYSDNISAHYRNKVEFSWYGDNSANGEPTLDLAFFRRGSKGKLPIESCGLLPDAMQRLALAVRDLLQVKGIEARSLKTLLIRSSRTGVCTWQLYLKEECPDIITADEAAALPAQGGEILYSDPKSPASRITRRLAAYGNPTLTDTILSTTFQYATEGFFQINLPVYEQTLRDMKPWITNSPVVDLYSGVGTIGLTVGGDHVTLVEINEDAVREMRRNIASLGRGKAVKAILAPSEKTLDVITPDSLIIVDPPRAGLHVHVIDRILTALPERIVYLSCNPTTQARDVAMLGANYGVRHHKGYNFFPRTPHIEHLIILDKKSPYALD